MSQTPFFESSLKDEHPPHPGDTRSAKKVKLKPPSPEASLMEISPQASQETHVSPTPAYIPETPQAATIPVEPPPENPHTPTRPSFKDKLLH